MGRMTHEIMSIISGINISLTTYSLVLLLRTYWSASFKAQSTTHYGEIGRLLHALYDVCRSGFPLTQTPPPGIPGNDQKMANQI